MLGGLSLLVIAPFPGQQLTDAFGGVVADAADDVGEIG